MRIVVTGASGFLARNLRVRLQELGHADFVCVTRETSRAQLEADLATCDLVFHLAGVNRPKDPSEFVAGNAGFTDLLCTLASKRRPAPPIVFASSTQATLSNAYGLSKLAAEERLQRYQRETDAAACIFRLTNVFGKWARPNYNSAIATFCHNLAHGLSITVNDPHAVLRLVYVDDVVAEFTGLLQREIPAGQREVKPVFETTVGEVAQLLQSFVDSRQTMLTERVGTGLTRALYSTYLSYLPRESFDYQVARHEDARGVFVEMLKTPDCGQFSYFTAHPGVTRGEHYHHSKTEKFLVIKGVARFGFRHIQTGETHELTSHGGEARIVETIPGWTHNITNIGDDELLVMLWANEIFDRAKPDTIPMKVHR